MLKKLFRLVLSLVLCLQCSLHGCMPVVKKAFAIIGTGTGEEKKQGITKEKQLEAEKNKEKRKSKGKKEEKTISTKVSKEIRDSVRKALSLRNDRTFEITLTASEIAFPVLAELEKANKDIFGKCKLISNPPVRSDLGINFTFGNGKWIDETAKEYWNSLAQANSVTPPEVEEKLKKYAFCAMEYSKKIASALLCLREEIKDLKDWIGLADVKKLFHECLNKEDKSITETVKSLKTLWGKCRFRGSLDNYVCGGFEVSINPLSIWVGKLHVFGENNFIGISATYRLSSVWSLDKAWETLKSKAKSNDKIKQIVNYVEKLESRGKVYKAALLKRKVLDQAKTGNIHISLTPTSE